MARPSRKPTALAETPVALDRVRRVLVQHGLLLQHDARWPSVTTLVAGEPVRGSWWGHRAGHTIFAVLQALEDEVASPKLLAGKVTLVHARLWPALAGVGSAHEGWQLANLRADAADVLDLVEAEGEIACDDISLTPDCRPITAIATDLERRLLLSTDHRHTERGHHERVLRSWRRFPARPLRATDARAELEAATVGLAGETAVALLPWRRRRAASARPRG